MAHPKAISHADLVRVLDRFDAEYLPDSVPYVHPSGDPAAICGRVVLIRLPGRSQGRVYFESDRCRHDWDPDLRFLLKLLKVNPEEFWRIYREVVEERGSARP